MKKIAIANRGKSNQGKSTTIRDIYYMLKDKYEPSNKTIFGGSDVKAIIIVGEIKIGIECQGDPSSRHGESIDQFVKEGCHVIISACRTKGETCQKMRSLKDNDYDVIWTSNMRSKDEDLNITLNKKYVDTIVSIVDNYIEENK